MNVKLLKKVKAAILKEPKQFMMSDWYQALAGIPNCGTAACIGGWAASIHDKLNPKEASKKWHKALTQPQEALGLGHLEADRLFYVHSWPSRFARKYFHDELPGHAAHNAKVAAARIDHFIKTKGRE